MHVYFRSEGAFTYFIISEVDAGYHPVLKHMFYHEQDGVFMKRFPSHAPYLDTCYRNFTQHLETVLLHMADIERVPWERALEALLEILSDMNVDWWLGGSAALAVRGVPIIPHDIDVITDRSGTIQIRDRFQDYLFEPIVDVTNWICKIFGRLFLYAAIDVAGDVESTVDIPEPTDFGPYAASRLERVTWRGYLIYVPPVDLQLRQNVRRGLTDRVQKIKQVLF
jgi:hypothetical protein